MPVKDSPVNKLRDRDEYAAFISELLILITARNSLARKQKADKACHDENTAVVKSMRRILPLAQALYPHLSGDFGQRLVRKGKNPVYIDRSGKVWIAGQLIAWEC